MKKTDNPYLAKVIANQEAIAQDQAAAEKLRAKIAEKRAAITAAESALPKIDSMEKARQDLLASVEMGEAKAGEIKKFDDERAAERAAYESARESFLRFEDEVMQMISGLQRKLDEIEAHLAEQQAARSWLVHSLIYVCAKQTGEEYLEAARKTYDLYVRLLGINSLASRIGLPINIARFNNEFAIPSFALEGIEGGGIAVGFGALFDNWKVNYGTEITDSANAIESELSESGVQL